MILPTVDFLVASIIVALLDYYEVTALPVPVRKFISSPPPDLAGEISLVEDANITFLDAVWVRPAGKRGMVLVNAALPEADRRYSMAREFFVGLCHARGGKEVGLASAIRMTPNDYAERFARRLLAPKELLPANWRNMPAGGLAALCLIPVTVAEARLADSVE
ncbi:MAG: hypothetical protein FJ030_12695 [Chloroflexi bacterium]|nr:hypothetical protein [Chloroflexota bacterium]